MHTIFLTGNTPNQTNALLGPHDIALHVASKETARIQESHIVIIHSICEILDKQVQLHHKSETQYA